jgi:hypothetical protein
MNIRPPGTTGRSGSEEVKVKIRKIGCSGERGKHGAPATDYTVWQARGGTTSGSSWKNHPAFFLREQNGFNKCSVLF